jgi:tRNA nucleotidyltransferase (CCA-adding enzyme)
MTRREAYASAGVLPEVEPAPIEEDLTRRDFTMNALALRLDADAALLDPMGGRADLSRRTIRVLHDRSFEDDATRIFRALRYAARLQFSIEARTSALLVDGVGHISAISGERVRHELMLLFEEPTGSDALERLDQAGALAAIHPALSWSPLKSAALGKVVGRSAVPAGLALLASDCSSTQSSEVSARLQLTREESEAVRAMPALTNASAMLHRGEAKPSGVVAVLERFAEAALRAFAALSADEVVVTLIGRYLGEWRHEKPELSGDDLLAMGIPEGPQIGRGLQLLRAARLDGWVSDRDDERALMLRFAKSIRDSRAMSQPIDFKFNGC